MINEIDCLENISSLFEEMEIKNKNKNKDIPKFMKEQITDYDKLDLFKINFNYCHIAITKNGGLIAICKKKGFIDISRGGNLGKFIIVMYQDAKKIYNIPINWDYNKRWIVCLDFTKKDDLYGILNDGGIFKFNYYEEKYKEVVTSQTLKSEKVLKAKFFEKGFIAYTACHNFYIIKDIKDPFAIILCSFLDYVDFDENVDFLPISSDNSSSDKIELLITRQDDKDGGVIQVIQKEEGQNVQFFPMNLRWFDILGAYLILKEKPRKFYVNKYEKDKEKEEKKRKEEEEKEKDEINKNDDKKKEKKEKKEKKDKKDIKKEKEEEEQNSPPIIQDLGTQKEI